MENVLGTGNSRGLTGAEFTLSLSQLIEMGDKPQKRIDLVDAKSNQLQQDFERQRLDILSDATARYIKALRIDTLLAWNQQRLLVEQQALEVIQQRANAGAVGQADVLRMQLLLERSESRQQQLNGERRLAYQQLASSWGGKWILWRCKANSSSCLCCRNKPCWNKQLCSLQHFYKAML